jgi:prolipoprotein diacylglyceryltransferase
MEELLIVYFLIQLLISIIIGSILFALHIAVYQLRHKLKLDHKSPEDYFFWSLQWLFGGAGIIVVLTGLIVLLAYIF